MHIDTHVDQFSKTVLKSSEHCTEPAVILPVSATVQNCWKTYKSMATNSIRVCSVRTGKVKGIKLKSKTVTLLN
jgi:hypothetical protein